MEKVRWKRKKEESQRDAERKEILQSMVKGEEMVFMEREVTIGYNSGQFIVRLPSDFAQHIGLESKKAKNKIYKLKLKINTSTQDKNSKLIKGNFEVTKNE